MEKIRYIEDNEKILAIIIYGTDYEEGVKFVTPENFSLQVGLHNRKEGENITPHKHPDFLNLDTLRFQEIVHVTEGKLEIGVYDPEDKLYEEIMLKKGDTILFNSGHSVKFISDSKILNIKQGPHRQEDKTFL
ncbi:MAG: hypothetical protein ISR65_19960 [Bacteriovoracaceae bacterium]|nr:hypothetical protein [Bacteriovoracaceae bacterium]